MNPTTPIPPLAKLRATGRTLKRFLALIGLALVFGLTGCNAPGFGQGKALRALEEQVAGLLNVQQQIEQRLGLWQAAAAVLFVLAGFALIGGAALGSRARRLRDRHRAQGHDGQTSANNPTQPSAR